MIYLLLIAFQVKHFLADYPLQLPYMLGKFKEKGWVGPLADHCTIHAVFTWMISSVAFSFDPEKSWIAGSLALLDFSLHFIMDRIKASPHMLGRFQSLSKSDFAEHQRIMENYEPLYCHPVVEVQIERESIKWRKRLKHNTYFWWSLGLDQMVHHLTHYLIIYLLVSST